MVKARVFVLVWFAAAFTLSATGWFAQFSSPTLFVFGAVISATAFAVLYSLSNTFRAFSRARGLKRLTQVQVLRFFGTLALIKSDQRVLPAAFAIPTGVMDIVIALGSLYVASHLISSKGGPKPGFVAWHVAGLATLATSAILAVLTSSTPLGILEKGITSQPLTWFPMSLVPTFIGPFVLVCHLLAIAASYASEKKG